MNNYNSDWVHKEETTTPTGLPYPHHYEYCERPMIVCLCGSTRFYEMFQQANYEETMAGKIVLSVGFYRPSPQSKSEVAKHSGTNGETWGCTPDQKIALDVLHKHKIDLADEVFVLNVGGYIGESTRSEIEHAKKRGKPIRYLEEPKS